MLVWCWLHTSLTLLFSLSFCLSHNPRNLYPCLKPAALLSGTLRTYQRAACDGDVVALRCPPGTSISVQLAQYGRGGNSPTLCPAPVPTTPLPFAGAEPAPCLWPNALQVCGDLSQTNYIVSDVKGRSRKFFDPGSIV
jgi:hypothetical protein